VRLTLGQYVVWEDRAVAGGMGGGMPTRIGKPRSSTLDLLLGNGHNIHLRKVEGAEGYF
jgi:hypothetical protein